MLNIKKALTELSNKMSELFTSLTVSTETLSTTSGADVRLTNILFTPLNRIAQILRRKEVGAVC